MGRGGGNNENGDLGDSAMSSKKAKLKADLEVVMENIDLTNSIIDTCVAEKQMDDLLPSMIENLSILDTKMSGLVEKLADKNEEDMFDMVLTIIEDLNQTQTRFTNMTNRKRP